jgi:hypothetical protein
MPLSHLKNLVAAAGLFVDNVVEILEHARVAELLRFL